jgi:hypothetical protein
MERIKSFPKVPGTFGSGPQRMISAGPEKHQRDTQYYHQS